MTQDYPMIFLPSGLPQCQNCDLHTPKVRVVGGYGMHDSRIMLIAQSPGAQENQRGIPLIGPSGDKLRECCRAAGLNLDDLFRTNVNKCQPPGNEKTSMAQKRACYPWLQLEIETVDPDVIVLLGDEAKQMFLPEESKVTDIHGNIFRRHIHGRERQLIVTFHPAALLRNEHWQPMLISDLRTARYALESNSKLDSIIPFRTTPGTEEELLDFIARRPKIFGLDLETDSLERDAEIVGVGVCDTPGNTLYYPLNTFDEQIRVLHLLKPLLEDPTLIKVATNRSFEHHNLHNYGIRTVNLHDTLLRSWILGNMPLGLKDYVHAAFGIEMIRIKKFQDMGFKKKDRYGVMGVDFKAAQLAVPDQAIEYAAQDADASLRSYFHQEDLFEQRPDAKRIYEEIELPFAEEIFNMVDAGFGFNAESSDLKEAIKFLTAFAREMEEWMWDLAEQHFNPRSAPQVANILYDLDGKQTHDYVIRDLPRMKKGAKGLPTDKVSLGGYMDNQLVRCILSVRALDKMVGTYLAKLPNFVEGDGRIHCDLKQTNTATGRMASARPNLQNIPTRKRGDVDMGGFDPVMIRKAFVANADPSRYKRTSNSLLYCPDLSQIEMRFAAHLSGDEFMIKAISEGMDIHDETTRTIISFSRLGRKATDDEWAEIYAGIEKREWKNTRDTAKVVGFGSLYGLQAQGLIARTPEMRLTIALANEFIDGFYFTFPELRPWQQGIVEFTRKHGYAETILERRRYLPDIHAKHPGLRAEAERAAMNVPIQGSAADYFKLCVLAVGEKIRELQLETRMIMQVHDEIVMEGPDYELEVVANELVPLMRDRMVLAVPVKVDLDYGPNWGEMKAYEWTAA